MDYPYAWASPLYFHADYPKVALDIARHTVDAPGFVSDSFRDPRQFTSLVCEWRQNFPNRDPFVVLPPTVFPPPNPFHLPGVYLFAPRNDLVLPFVVLEEYTGDKEHQLNKLYLG